MRALRPLLLGLFSAPALAAPYEEGNFQHKDWQVYCAPRTGCEALATDNGTNTGYLTLTIARLWGPEDAPVVRLSFGPPASELVPDGEYTVRFTVSGEGYTVGHSPLAFETTSSGSIELSREASTDLIIALLNGERLGVEMRFPDEEVLAEVSLAGISASLRWMDDFQSRAGTTSAIVARGEREMTLTPPPAIYASAPSDLPQAVQEAWVNTGNGCEELDPVHFELSAEGHVMENGKTLWLLPCGYPGAYNMPMVTIVEHDGEVFAKAPISFATPGHDGAVTTTLMLYNMSFEPKSGALTSFFRGRGLGDCGLYQVHTWDGEGFGLIEARMKDDCDGQFIELQEWPLLFGAGQD